MNKAVAKKLIINVSGKLETTPFTKSGAISETCVVACATALIKALAKRISKKFETRKNVSHNRYRCATVESKRAHNANQLDENNR
jgi:actin-like ATPase involved in cell morphogenesis